MPSPSGAARRPAARRWRRGQMGPRSSFRAWMCGIRAELRAAPLGLPGPSDSGSQAVGLGWHGTVPSGLRRVGSPSALPAACYTDLPYLEGEDTQT